LDGVLVKLGERQAWQGVGVVVQDELSSAPILVIGAPGDMVTLAPGPDFPQEILSRRSLQPGGLARAVLPFSTRTGRAAKVSSSWG
jgi:hypothetical protein